MKRESYTLDSLHNMVAVYCATNTEISALIDAIRAHKRREDKWFEYRNEKLRQERIEWFKNNGYTQRKAEKIWPPGPMYLGRSEVFALSDDFNPSAPATISINQVLFEPCPWVLRFRARSKEAYEKAGFDVINYADLVLADTAMERGFTDD